MSWKDLFVVPDDTKKPDPKESKPATKSEAPSFMLSPRVSSPLPGTSDKATLDTSTYNDLFRSVMAGSTGYTQFLKHCEALKSVLPDENTRFASAFAIVGANGLTQAQIAQALGVHISLLEDEKTKFDKEVQKQADACLGQEEQCAHLDQQIAELMKQKEALRAEIARQKETVDRVRREFEAAYTAILQQLNRDKAKFTEEKG